MKRFWFNWRGNYLFWSSLGIFILAFLVCWIYADIQAEKIIAISNCMPGIDDDDPACQVDFAPIYWRSYPETLGYMLLPTWMTWGIFVLRRAKRTMNSYAIALCAPFLSLVLINSVNFMASSYREDFSLFLWSNVAILLLCFIPCFLLGLINASFVLALPKEEREEN